MDVNMIANLSDGTVMNANISFNTNTFELQRLCGIESIQNEFLRDQEEYFILKHIKDTPRVYLETLNYKCEPSFLFSVQGGKLLFERRILIGLFLESNLSKIAGFELKSENHSMSENCSKSANNPKSKKKRK